MSAFSSHPSIPPQPIPPPSPISTLPLDFVLVSFIIAPYFPYFYNVHITFIIRKRKFNPKLNRVTGIPIRTTLDNSTTVQYAGLLHQLTMKAKSTVRDIDPQNDLTFLRIRSKKHEIMVAPGNLAFHFICKASFHFII